MVILTAIIILSGLTDGVFSSVVFLYVDVYLQRAEDFPLVLIVGQSFILIALPIALFMMRRFGKHQTWAGGLIVILAGCFTLLFTGPDDPFWPVLLAVIFIYAGASAMNVASVAILADVVDYDTLKTGHNRSGQYFSFHALLEKANFAVAERLRFTYSTCSVSTRCWRSRQHWEPGA
jgi:Na+/melibiose symporter-like transporter